GPAEAVRPGGRDDEGPQQQGARPVISVEYHRHELAEPLDLTPYCTGASVRHFTSAPWEVIDLELAVPRRLWGDMLPISPRRRPQAGWLRTGGWVVVRYPAGARALAWGRVVSISTGVEARRNGHIETERVRVSCASWLSLLSAGRLIVAEGSGIATDGAHYVLDLKAWAKRLEQLLAALTTPYPGVLLKSIWPDLVQFALPDSLGVGPTLGGAT